MTSADVDRCYGDEENVTIEHRHRLAWDYEEHDEAHYHGKNDLMGLQPVFYVAGQCWEMPFYKNKQADRCR